MNTNWQQEVQDNLSGQGYSLKEMLDEYLAYVQHGLSNNDFTANDVNFVNINGQQHLEAPDSSGNPLYISMSDLNNFGYFVNQGQSAEDFINANWCYY